MDAEPRSAEAQSPPALSNREQDATRKFVDMLRGSGLLSDLDDQNTEAFCAASSTMVHASDRKGRHLDLLRNYYDAGGDSELAESRLLKDRFILHRDDAQTEAAELLGRISAVHPELPSIAIERLGEGLDSPLILRSGDHICALDDDGLDVLEDGKQTVSVQSLVRATNVLLARHEERRRLLMLQPDAFREAFIAVPMSEAIRLCRGGVLEAITPQNVMRFGGW